jgi:hypothetical protein
MVAAASAILKARRQLKFASGTLAIIAAHGSETRGVLVVGAAPAY